MSGIAFAEWLLLSSRRVKRKTITIIGPGRLGSALAHALNDTGYEIREIICGNNVPSRTAAERLAREVGTKAALLRGPRLDADVIWFCVPDSKIAEAAEELGGGNLRDKIALHSSGALSSDVLGTLRRKGAMVASVHPLMTFVSGSRPSLAGVPFALEGNGSAVRAARKIVKDLAGVPFAVSKRHKQAYHAFATMVCPLLISLLATSERVAGLAGISPNESRRRMMPIIRQTLANYERLGPAASFSGPIVRGDAEIIAKHLATLEAEPVAREAYSGLVSAALECLPSKNRNQITFLLGQQSPPTRRSGKGKDQGRRRRAPRR